MAGCRENLSDFSRRRGERQPGDPGTHTNRRGKWGLLLPGAPGPRLNAAKTPGLQIGLSNRVTRPEQPEHSCRWQLLLWPDNGGTMPSESAPFTPSSILFRPHRNPPGRAWVEAPGTAPGSEGFIATAIYRRSRLAPT